MAERDGTGASDAPHTDAVRVAVVADWWWPETVGGAERTARQMAQTVATFADVAVFVPAWEDRSYPDGALSVTAVRKLLARREHGSHALWKAVEFASTWLNPLSGSLLRRKIRAYGPDVVVVTNTARTGPWLLRWLKRKQYVTVRVYHDLSDTCWRRSRLREGKNCLEVCGSCQLKVRAMRRSMPADVRAVSVSGFVRTEVTRYGLVAPERATVGYPLIAVGGPKDGPRTGPVHAGEVTLGFLGRIIEEKGVDRAILVAAAFAETSGLKVSFLVAGTGRPEYLETLRRLAATHGLEVVFAGEVAVDEFCAAVDAALIPSSWLEPFGRVVVEVGAQGVPMLLSPVGGIPEAAEVSGAPHAFADFTEPQAAAAALATLIEACWAGETAMPNKTGPDVSLLSDAVAAAVRQAQSEKSGRGGRLADQRRR